MDAVKIEIPSLSDNIRIIESFIDNAKEKFDLNDDIYGNIMIAVTESVNNAIVHGNKNDKTKNVQLSLHIEDQLVRFVVEDEGEGFDYDTLPDPTAPENLEKTGGRGIFLMKNLCDDVKFDNNGKKVEMSFYLQ
ncbi:MAG: ATP-binding protein [Reichenbachiella sp.]